MSFKFFCPHCKQKIEAEDEWIGMEADCPECGKAIKVVKPTASTIIKTVTNNQNNSDNQPSNNEFSAKADSNQTQKSSKTLVKIFTALILIVLFISIGDHLHSHVELEGNHVELECYFYDESNQKIIPCCDFEIYPQAIELEKSFSDCLSLQNDILCEKHKSNIKDFEGIFASIYSRRVSSCNHNLFYSRINISPVLKNSFKKGCFKTSNLKNGEYTLYASAWFKGQKDFNDIYWVKHFSIRDKSINITLTNDASCYVLQDTAKRAVLGK